MHIVRRKFKAYYIFFAAENKKNSFFFSEKNNLALNFGTLQIKVPLI